MPPGCQTIAGCEWPVRGRNEVVGLELLVEWGVIFVGKWCGGMVSSHHHGTCSFSDNLFLFSGLLHSKHSYPLKSWNKLDVLFRQLASKVTDFIFFFNTPTSSIKAFLFFEVKFPQIQSCWYQTTDRFRNRQAKLMDLKRREDLKDALVEKFKAAWAWGKGEWYHWKHHGKPKTYGWNLIFWTTCPSLGGGFRYFFKVHPEPWGFMIQFDSRIFFRWVGSTNHWGVQPPLVSPGFLRVWATDLAGGCCWNVCEIWFSVDLLG